MFHGIMFAVTMYTSGLTGALYAAGGGAGEYSTVRALNTMLGEANVQSEMQHLEDQYGDTSSFVQLFDFAMNDAWTKAGKANVSVRTDSNLTGDRLADALVRADTRGHPYTVPRLLS